MIVSQQLRDDKNEFIGFLDINDFGTFKETYAINGVHYIDLEVSLDHPYKDYLIKRNRIMYKDEDSNKWFCFFIQGIKRDDTIQLHCESYLYELCSCLIPSLTISGNTVITGLTKILTGSYPRSNIQIGTTDIAGTFDMSHIKQSAKYDLYAWAEKVSGEISERIEWSDQTPVFYVDILSRVGSDTGIMRYDDLDLSNYSENEPVDDYYTAAFGFGVIENDVQLTFENVEWLESNGDPVDKPIGQAYVTLSDTLKELYGIYVSGEYQHRYYSYEDTQISDAAELLLASWEWLVANILSKTEYSVDDYDVDREVGCGDSITLVLTRYNTRFSARSIKIVEDMLTGKRSHDFNFKTRYITETISQVASTAKAAAVTASAAKVTAEANYISSVRDRLNSEIEADETYNSFTTEDGLLSLNAASYDLATMATSIKGGSIRIANTKDGETFDFTTILTGDGILADAVTTGVIRGENFDIDLNAGVFRFGQRINGVISEENTVTQFTVDGFTLVGAEVSAIVTNTAIKFINAINSNTIAEFTTAGLSTPTAIVETVLQVGKARFQKDGNDLGILIND